MFGGREQVCLYSNKMKKQTILFYTSERYRFLSCIFKKNLVKVCILLSGVVVILFVIIVFCQPGYASYQQPKFICEIFLTDNVVSRTSLTFLRNIKEKQPGMILLAYGPDKIENSIFIKQRITTLNLSSSRPVIVFNGSVFIEPEKTGKWRKQCTTIVEQLSTVSPANVEFSLSIRMLKNKQAEMQFHACNMDTSKWLSGYIEIWEVWNEKTAVTGKGKQWTKIKQIHRSSIKLPPYAKIKKCPFPEWLSLQEIRDKNQWQIIGLMFEVDGKLIGIDGISTESAIGSNQR